MEWQSNNFGGLTLVSLEPLRKQVFENILKLQKEGLVGKAPKGLVWEYVADDVAKHFCVSADVIKRRLDDETMKGELETHF